MHFLFSRKTKNTKVYKCILAECGDIWCCWYHQILCVIVFGSEKEQKEFHIASPLYRIANSSSFCFWSMNSNTFGAESRMPHVPPSVTPKNTYSRRRSMIIATYFQSSRIWKVYCKRVPKPHLYHFVLFVLFQMICDVFNRFYCSLRVRRQRIVVGSGGILQRSGKKPFSLFLPVVLLAWASLARSDNPMLH